MSETTAHTSDAPLFSEFEIEEFAADDVVAGKAIGQMLSLLFLYTVLAMALVSWWTFSTVSSRTAQTAPTAQAVTH